MHIIDKLGVSEGNVLALHYLFRPHIQSDPDFSPQGLDMLSRRGQMWWGHPHRSFPVGAFEIDLTALKLFRL